MKPALTFRQEPAADLTGLTPAMRACLSDLSSGRALFRFPKGYALMDEMGRAGPVHSLRVVDALLDRGLIRRGLLIPAGEAQRYVHLTGDGAWVVRTLRREQP
jgi:hypothetical protein